MKAFSSVLVIMVLLLGAALPALAYKQPCESPLTCAQLKDRAEDAIELCRRSCALGVLISTTPEYKACARLPWGAERRTCMDNIEIYNDEAARRMDRCEAEKEGACSQQWKYMNEYDYKCDHNFCDPIMK